MREVNQYDSHLKPTWCPGCGNFGIFTALKEALAQLKIKPHKVAIVTDVGCSGNNADFFKAYTLHALHGRALPPAAGIKLANHQLTVLAIIGDGGCYGEGLTHLINLMRGNHDITVLVHNNHLYSLTTGQYSPTTPKGTVTKSTPDGSIEVPLNPVALGLANQAAFVARGYAFSQEHLKSTLTKAIRHVGFSLVDILQPCVTFDKNQTAAWYQERVFKLKKKFSSRQEAFTEALREDKLGLGIFWQEKRPAYHQELKVLEGKPLIAKPIEKVNLGKLIEEFI